MKSKQLADVLLKILGLSTALRTIPTFFSTISITLSPLWVSTPAANPSLDRIDHQAIANGLSFAVTGVIELVIGILLIVRSRKIAEFWFKNEAEQL